MSFYWLQCVVIVSLFHNSHFVIFVSIFNFLAVIFNFLHVQKNTFSESC